MLISGESVPGRENSLCKGPGMEMGPVCCSAASRPVAEQSEGQVGAECAGFFGCYSKRGVNHWGWACTGSEHIPGHTTRSLCLLPPAMADVVLIELRWGPHQGFHVPGGESGPKAF